MIRTLILYDMKIKEEYGMGWKEMRIVVKMVKYDMIRYDMAKYDRNQ